MNGPDLERRSFLRTLAGGAAGVGLLGSFEALSAAVRPGAHGRPTGPAGALDPEALRADYLLDPSIVYLNHASIGTIPAAVHQARTGYLSLCETHPHLYMWGGAWDAARADARAALAEYVGSIPERIALTHNTTEGFNLFANGLPIGPGDEVLFSDVCHHGASECFERFAPRRGFSVRHAAWPLEDAAEMSTQDIVDATLSPIGPATRVFVVPHMDNMIGVRIPLAAVVDGARARGVEWVLADGAQTTGMVPLALDASGVDGYAGSPHKWLQAPKGLGFLHVADRLAEVLEPMWVTSRPGAWDDARRFEDYGTRNLPETLTLYDAVAWQGQLERDGAKDARLRAMRTRLRDAVDASPRLEWRSPRAWDDGGSLVAVRVRGRPAPELGARLWEEHGVVVRAFGGGRLDTLRISPNVMTTDAELDRLLALLETL